MDANGNESPASLAHICQACREATSKTEIPCGAKDGAYRLCEECAQRLKHFALRPLEWFNLAALHGPFSYHLHDDFYDEDGKAYQPSEEVVASGKFPSPSLNQIKGDLRRLVDFGMSRWFITKSCNSELTDVLRGHEPTLVLKELRERVTASKNPWIEGRAYNLASLVLRHEAASWIRERAEIHAPETFTNWAFACSQCLPLLEGFGLVTCKLSTLPKRDVTIFKAALMGFRSERTLDWIESNHFAPIVESWGRLAALSQFDWARAIKWLRIGRPLSLIALDALDSCWHYDTIPLKEEKPKLLRPVSTVEMIEELQ